ncbi:MAG TPA: cob(I)yrinic acid a,c-diamide adenosyltransferase [Patescibacteria group bacterium]
MKIYTKKGDKGETSLFGGQRVAKSSLRIDAYGNIDELNSLLGVILAKNPHKEISQNLTRVQRHLFVLGADLATPEEVKVKVPRINTSAVKVLEKEIDNWTKQLPQLRNFILPGGSETGALLHMARTVCRRSERTVVALSEIEKINENVMIYLNRLSDWLFTLARYVNKLEKINEVPWKGRG